MRYWQHGETGRLLKINVPMAPIHWVEITKEQYEDAERINNGAVPAKTEVKEEKPS